MFDTIFKDSTCPNTLIGEVTTMSRASLSVDVALRSLGEDIMWSGEKRLYFGTVDSQCLN